MKDKIWHLVFNSYFIYVHRLNISGLVFIKYPEWWNGFLLSVYNDTICILAEVPYIRNNLFPLYPKSFPEGVLTPTLMNGFH